MTVVMIFSVIMAIAIFMILPLLIAGVFQEFYSVGDGDGVFRGRHPDR